MNKYNGRKDIWLYLDIFILALLLFLGMDSGTITIIASGLLCFSYLLRRPSSIVRSILFFYPFYCIFKLTGQGVSLYNYALLFAIIGLLRTWKSIFVFRISKIKYLIQLLLIFIVYLFIVGLLYSRNDIMTILLDFAVPIALLLSTFQVLDEVNVYECIIWFSISVVLAGLVGAEIIPVHNLYNYVEIVHYKTVGIRLVRCQGLTVNPNYYSVDVNMAMASLFVVPIIESQKRSLFNVVLLILLFVVGVFSISKSFYVGLFVILFFYFVLNKNPQGIVKQFIFGAVGATVFALFLKISNSVYINAIFDRFVSADDADSLTSGRTRIWLGYIEYLLSNPLGLLFGCGVGAKHPPGLVASHSFYIECLYYFGIFGCIVFVYFMNRILNFRKFNKYALIPLLVFLVRAAAINLVLREAFVTDAIIILLVFYVANVKSTIVTEEGVGECYEKS